METIETLQPQEYPTHSFMQHLEHKWANEAADERVVTHEFFYDDASEVDETAEDFEAWSFLFDTNTPNSRQHVEPVEDILARHPVPERRTERLKSTARKLGNLVLGAKDWISDHRPELHVSPRAQRGLGRLAAGTVAVILVAGAAHNFFDRHAPVASTKLVSPIAGQNVLKPLQLPELSNSNTAAAPIESSPPLNAINLNAIYQQVTADNNARLEAQRAKEQADAAEKAPSVAKAITVKNQDQSRLATNLSQDCEQYRPLVEQYPWPTEAAMLTMKKESGCNPNAVSDTDDYGLFQLNGRPVFDPDRNIRIAYELYKDGRVGSKNFSAWYAVCTEGDNPQSKFDGINCQ